MGLFDRLKRESKTVEAVHKYEPLIMCLCSDADMMHEMSALAENTELYYKNHHSEFDDRGISSSSPDDICFVGIINILQKNRLLFEFDYKTDISDFRYGLESIKRSRSTDRAGRRD